MGQAPFVMLPFGPGIGEVDKKSVGSVFGGENIDEAGDVISGETHVGFGAAVPQHFAVGVGENGVDHVDAEEIGIGMRFGCGGDKFWDTNRNCLYDTIEPYSLDIRPNQVLSMSLSYPIFDNENAKIMLNTVQEQLYTPYGLRTLSPYSKKYIGKYSGGVISRDNAYHQGTVWTWLLSEFIIAFCRINKYSLADRKRWISYIEVIQQNMDDHCINQLSEIFDGDEPHLPNGAFAQAWSVGNILKLFSEVE